MSTMTVNYEELKELSADQINTKIRSGEITLPDKGNERNEFLAFASMPTDKREDFLKEKGLVNPEPVQPKSAEEPKPVEPKSVETPEGLGDAPKSVGFKDLGYETEEEAIEALKAQQTLIEKQKERIDRFNAERGQNGRELKEANDQLKKLQEQIESLKKNVSEPGKKEIKRPTRPKPPSPKQFEDGVLSEEYQDALEKYHNEELPKYEQAYEEWFETKSNKTAKLDDETMSIVESAKDVTRKLKEDAKEREIKEKWGEFWSKDIAELQKDYGLDTTTSVLEINMKYGTMKDPNATQEEREEAELWLKQRPKKDLENYKKVTDLAHARYDLEGEFPKPKYRTWEAAIIDNGLKNQFSAPKEVPLTPQEEAELIKKQQSDGVAHVPSANDMSSNDTNIDEMGLEDKQKEYLKLTEEYREAMKSPKRRSEFENGPRFKRYAQLRHGLGIKLRGERMRNALG